MQNKNKQLPGKRVRPWAYLQEESLPPYIKCPYCLAPMSGGQAGHLILGKRNEILQRKKNYCLAIWVCNIPILIFQKQKLNCCILQRKLWVTNLRKTQKNKIYIWFAIFCTLTFKNNESFDFVLVEIAIK